LIKNPENNNSSDPDCGSDAVIKDQKRPLPNPV
jgi:hypothetical protein